MDDLLHGSRDKRGHWRPKDALVGVAPIYSMPPNPRAVLRWLPEYLAPWNIFIALTAVLYWVWIVPPAEVMQTLRPGWILTLYLANAAGILAFFGVFEAVLYWKRRQAGRFKYNPAFPGDRKSNRFWFGSQQIDNAIRTFASGITIWTAIEVIVLWAYANGWVLPLSWSESALWLGVLFFLVPVIHEAHFYCIHRLIHVPWLYRHVHAVHHRAVNPSPWSSLAMHPVEHILYFGVVAWYLVLPAHPLIAIFALHRAGFGAIPGHIGFDKIELGEGVMDTHAYAHYLHHKYFEVNYGDGLVPFDALFGTFHDGTPEGDARMRERLKERSAAARDV